MVEVWKVSIMSLTEVYYETLLLIVLLYDKTVDYFPVWYSPTIGLVSFFCILEKMEMETSGIAYIGGMTRFKNAATSFNSSIATL